MDGQRYNLRSSTHQQPQQLHGRAVASVSGVSSSTTSSAPPFTTSATSTSSLPTMSNVVQATAYAHQPNFGSSQSQPALGQHLQQQPQQVQQQYAQAQGSLGAPMIPPQGQEQLDQGGQAATAPFLRDFTLVAEAVKRVQMDAVMTEMESITL